MGLDTHPSETLPTLDWDSDALKFYEVVDGEVVENPPMGAMESILASLLQDLMGTDRPVERIGPCRDRNPLLHRSRPQSEAPARPRFCVDGAMALEASGSSNGGLGRGPRPGR